MKRICMILLAALLLVACQPTPETEFILNKGDQSAMIDMAKGEDMVTASGTESGKEPQVLDYRALYGIPERLTGTFSDAEGKVLVRIDAGVTVPTAPLPIVRVFAKDFDQETVTRIWNVLVGDTPMFELVDETNLNRRTQIESELQFMYAMLDDPALMQEHLYEKDEVTEEIARLQAEYQKAEDAEPKEKRRVDSAMWRRGVGFADKPDLTQQEGLWAISEDESVRFTVYNSTDNDEPIYETVDGGWNVIQNDKQASLGFRRASAASNVVYGNRTVGVPFGTILSETDPLPEQAKAWLPYSPKEAADRVHAFLAEAGLSDEFTIAYLSLDDDAGVYGRDDDRETLPHEPTMFCYHAVCTRKVSGAPCCNTEMNVHESRGGESTKTAYAPSWAYEQMHVYLDADGIFRFAWGTPLSVTDTITAFSKLKPFDEIETIIEKRFPLQYTEEANRATAYAGNPNTELPITEITVDRITLGLWRIAEQDKLGQGLLVPAYCFYGDMKSTWYQDGTPRIEYNDLLFVINAVDGSVIDPAKGY